MSLQILAIFSSSGLPKAELFTPRAKWSFPRTQGTSLHKFYPQNQPRAPLLQPHIKGDLRLTPIAWDESVFCFLLIAENILWLNTIFQHQSLKDIFPLNLRCCFHLSFM